MFIPLILLSANMAHSFFGRGEGQKGSSRPERRRQKNPGAIWPRHLGGRYGETSVWPGAGRSVMIYRKQ